MPAPRRDQILTELVTNPQSAAPLSVRLVLDVPAQRGKPMVGVRLVASGGTGGYVYSATGLAAIGGVLDPATGIISGTWAARGVFTGQCSVQDSSSTVSPDATWSVDVASSLTPLDATPPPGEVSVAYSYTFRVGGATGTVTWARTSGTLPAGLTLSAAGVLSGTPTNPFGFSYFTATATDAGSGDLLDIPVVVQMAEQLREVLPAIQTPVYCGTTVAIDIQRMWAGGVPPFTLVAAGSDPTGWPALGLSLAQQKSDQKWVIRGTIPFDGLAPNSQREVKTVWFSVRDVFGKVAVIHPTIELLMPVSGIESASNGVAAGVSPFRLNFKGWGVSGVTSTSTETAVQVAALGEATFDRSIAASLAYGKNDFAAMTQKTDVIRLNGSAGGASQVRGFYAGARAGQLVMWVNASTTTVTLNNEDTGEADATARFAIGAPLAIGPGHGAVSWYDWTSKRWRIVGSY